MLKLIQNPIIPEELKEALIVNNMVLTQAEDRYRKTTGMINDLNVSLIKQEKFMRYYMLPTIFVIALFGAIVINYLLK